jgi:hypothetical protein
MASGVLVAMTSDLVAVLFLTGVFLVPVGAGALIGRLWALAFAFLPLALWAVGLMSTGDTAAWFFLPLVTILFGVLIAAGIVVRRLASRFAR